MIYDLLAAIVVLLHFGFIIFAVLGALLLVRWPRLVWLHLPTAIWAMAIVFYGGTCPLTPLENWLRFKAGLAGYDESFIEHYIAAIIYPGEITTSVKIMLGLGVLIINLALYARIIKRRHQG